MNHVILVGKILKPPVNLAIDKEQQLATSQFVLEIKSHLLLSKQKPVIIAVEIWTALIKADLKLMEKGMIVGIKGHLVNDADQTNIKVIAENITYFGI